MELDECPENKTNVTVFLLMGFQTLPGLKPLLFQFFFIIYIFTTLGNILILATIWADVHLHSPMYFFLGNLSCLELGYTTIIMPTLLGAHLGEGIRIPLPGCITQFGIFAWFTSTECFLLAVMAYDRFVAICHPLNYPTLMDQQHCFHLALSTWVAGFIISLINGVFLCMLQFPEHNDIDHYFCDLEPFFKHACSGLSQIGMQILFFSCLVLSFQFLLIFVSYMYIIFTVWKIPSRKGKYKAFSTCSSHLTIVIGYFGVLILVYLVQSISEVFNLNKCLSLLYTIGTPLFNPLVYTLRNKEMREALKKVMSQMNLRDLQCYLP